MTKGVKDFLEQEEIDYLRKNNIKRFVMKNRLEYIEVEFFDKVMRRK